MARHRTVLKLGSAACAIAGLVACASPKEPARRVGQAEVAVHGAEAEHANPASSVDLKRASDELDRAKTALHQKDYDKADRLAEEASVDAELARVKAESGSAQKDATTLATSIQALRDEARRAAESPQ
jgi:hypothetical protein